MSTAEKKYHFKNNISVWIFAEDDDKAARVDELQALFKKTQALPQTQTISEDMIAEEVEKYRAGR